MAFAASAVALAGGAAPSARVDHALRLASATYLVPYGDLRSVASCESRLSPTAVNRHAVRVRGRAGWHFEHATGLFQFLPSTFAGTPYAALSIFDADANALAAGWLVKHDHGWGEWTCKP